MNKAQARLLGAEIADAVTGEAVLHLDPRVVNAVETLGAAVVVAEGETEEMAAALAKTIARQFAIRSKQLLDMTDG